MSAKTPVIGLLPSYSAQNNHESCSMCYVESVLTAGGAPILLPHMASEEVVEQLATLCDGFLFTGGPDVDPGLFGEDPWYGLGTVSPLRDRTEKLFYKAAIRTGKPIFGTCRGIQMMNVMEGGTLYQDLDTQFPCAEGVKLLKHRQDEKGHLATHMDVSAPGSLVAQCFGEKFGVNTFHHQAVKAVAPGCVATAWAEDGVIEAITMPGHRFWNAVQWHPEIMTPVDEGAKKLFRAFVDACRE